MTRSFYDGSILPSDGARVASWSLWFIYMWWACDDDAYNFPHTYRDRTIKWNGMVNGWDGNMDTNDADHYWDISIHLQLLARATLCWNISQHGQIGIRCLIIIHVDGIRKVGQPIVLNMNILQIPGCCYTIGCCGVIRLRIRVRKGWMTSHNACLPWCWQKPESEIQHWGYSRQILIQGWWWTTSQLHVEKLVSH